MLCLLGLFVWDQNWPVTWHRLSNLWALEFLSLVLFGRKKRLIPRLPYFRFDFCAWCVYLVVALSPRLLQIVESIIAGKRHYNAVKEDPRRGSGAPFETSWGPRKFLRTFGAYGFWWRLLVTCVLDPGLTYLTYTIWVTWCSLENRVSDRGDLSCTHEFFFYPNYCRSSTRNS